MTPFKPAAGGITVAIRLTPKASRNAVGGVAAGIDTSGQPLAALKVMVTAVPEAGRANEALIKLLAKEWKVAKSSITLVAGATDRNKVLHVAGDTGDLMSRLASPAPSPPIQNDPSGRSES